MNFKEEQEIILELHEWFMSGDAEELDSTMPFRTLKSKFFKNVCSTTFDDTRESAREGLSSSDIIQFKEINILRIAAAFQADEGQCSGVQDCNGGFETESHRIPIVNPRNGQRVLVHFDTVLARAYDPADFYLMVKIKEP